MPSNVSTFNGRAPQVAPTVASGQATAPAIAAVIADTGALAAGVYDLEITLGFSGVLAAGKHLSVEHRNAANAANVFQYGLCPAGASKTVYISRVVVAANERIRVVVGPVAAAAAEVTHATIRALLVP
jgi:hypothetical protein